MKGTKGNALFLILIAVALFAALSYAVTQSGRGGGSTDRETLSLKVAQMVNQTNAMRSYIQRMYTLGIYEQIIFDDSADTTSGTIYLPDRTTTTGSTVGIFNTAVTGVPQYVPPVEIYAAANQGGGTLAYAYVYNARLIEGGSDLGTSAGDELIEIEVLTEDACAEINKNMFDDSSIPTATGGANFDAQVFAYNKNKIFFDYATGLRDYNMVRAEGCSDFGGASYIYLLPVKIN